MADTFSFAHGSNISYVESLYEEFVKNPNGVDPSWQAFFSGYELAANGRSLAQSLAAAAPVAAAPRSRLASSEGSVEGTSGLSHAQVEAFINAYRRLGHLHAWLNPLEEAKPVPAELQPEAHGLGTIQPEMLFQTSNFFSREPMRFGDIQAKLAKTYCSTIGADFRDINHIESIVWLQEKMESCENRPSIPVPLKKRILEKLAQAEGLERFLQTRFLGQKRFSVEGLDVLVSLLDILMDQAAKEGVEEMCLGMAHRGRLNVLCNNMEKPYEILLDEFEGTPHSTSFDIDGDVKYHKGFAKDIRTCGGKDFRVYLAPNPSHLECIDPVVEGFVRRRQEQLGQAKAIVPVLLHGDAAFIGQGIVPETLNLSQLTEYSTGGTIHIITNNQIGFTTNPNDGRSCPYSSDIAKMVHAPVFHVNANDPEAVAWVGMLAVQFRNQFARDVVIDLIGYRRYGHNETDEPAFTQPVMYQKIRNMPTVFTLYMNQLVAEGVVTADLKKKMESQVRESLNQAHQNVKDKKLPTPVYPPSMASVFSSTPVERAKILEAIPTSVTREKLQPMAEKMLTVPDSFSPHPKIAKLLQGRQEMLAGEGAIDWGLGELLAFASLAAEGYHVRLSGQDCKRGTFSSRHGVLFDEKTNEPYEPLNQMGAKGKVHLINSPLSEQGCLGFEFGYSLADANSLVLWEAQFGDFVNGAQIIIDQFVVASEVKWNQSSGLVLLLPHGHEGMGPEHSSARPERFLQLCGNLNIQVGNVTTPAQLFHILRRQMLRTFRKPLILFTPKSLLRHPHVVSTWKEFSQGGFQEILLDAGADKKLVQKMILCTGKMYREIKDVRDANPLCQTIPLLRMEQLYPYPAEKMKALFSEYPALTSVIWVQEEPQNMGFWNFCATRLREMLPGKEVRYVGRKASGSTAEGSLHAHQAEQKRIVQEAFFQACGWKSSSTTTGT